MDGDPLPDSHHFVRHCSPDTVGDDNRPTFAAFYPNGKSDHLSGHWAEFFGKLSDDELFAKIRDEANGDGVDIIYERKDDGRYARIQVRDIRNVHEALDVQEKAGRYPSHIGLFGLDDVPARFLRDVAVKLSKLARGRDIFPAVTTEHPRIKRRRH